MITISDKDNKRIADLEDNCIVLPETAEVLGVVLGNHVYGRNGMLKGKIIHHTFYSLNGEIMAKEKSFSGATARADRREIRRKGWSLVHSIKEYNSDWIEPKMKWSDHSLDEVLMG